jgi:hypothetical protein
MSPDDVIAANALLWAAVCGVSALVAPWVAMLISRRAAAVVAGLLTLMATILAYIFNKHNHVDGNVNIRPDVLLFPLLVVAWLQCIGLAVLVALKRPRTNN